MTRTLSKGRLFLRRQTVRLVPVRSSCVHHGRDCGCGSVSAVGTPWRDTDENWQLQWVACNFLMRTEQFVEAKRSHCQSEYVLPKSHWLTRCVSMTFSFFSSRHIYRERRVKPICKHKSKGREWLSRNEWLSRFYLFHLHDGLHPHSSQSICESEQIVLGNGPVSSFKPRPRSGFQVSISKFQVENPDPGHGFKLQFPSFKFKTKIQVGAASCNLQVSSFKPISMSGFQAVHTNHMNPRSGLPRALRQDS